MPRVRVGGCPGPALLAQEAVAACHHGELFLPLAVCRPEPPHRESRQGPSVPAERCRAGAAGPAAPLPPEERARAGLWRGAGVAGLSYGVFTPCFARRSDLVAERGCC